MIMAFSAILLLLTKQMTIFIESCTADTISKERVAAIRMCIYFALLLVQFIMIMVLLSTGESQFKQDDINDRYQIWIKCSTTLKPIHLLLWFVPLILWMVAFYFAIRERNEAHVFHERKLLNFGCLALLLLYIVTAVGFKFLDDLVGLLCFSLQVTTLLILLCFIVPRIYVGFMRSRKGEHLFPLKKQHHGNDQSLNTTKREVRDSGENNELQQFKFKKLLNMLTPHQFRKNPAVAAPGPSAQEAPSTHQRKLKTYEKHKRRISKRNIASTNDEFTPKDFSGTHIEPAVIILENTFIKDEQHQRHNNVDDDSTNIYHIPNRRMTKRNTLGESSNIQSGTEMNLEADDYFHDRYNLLNHHKDNAKIFELSVFNPTEKSSDNDFKDIFHDNSGEQASSDNNSDHYDDIYHTHSNVAGNWKRTIYDDSP